MGRRHQLLPHQQHLGRLVRLVLRQLREVGRPARAHLQELFRLCMDSSHYYRQYWYWGGEAKLRVDGTKLELTSIPDAEWATVEGRGGQVLGRDRGRDAAHRQGGGHPESVQRGHGQGRTPLSLHLSGDVPDHGTRARPGAHHMRRGPASGPGRGRWSGRRSCCPRDVSGWHTGLAGSRAGPGLDPAYKTP